MKSVLQDVRNEKAGNCSRSLVKKVEGDYNIWRKTNATMDLSSLNFKIMVLDVIRI